MKSSVLSQLLISFFIGVIILSCNEKKAQFTVQGKIFEADSALLYLEKRALTETFILDSVRLDKNGDYKFKETIGNSPEFYSLRLNNQLINFAVDSVQTISINTSAKTFARNYTVEGSESSAKMQEITLNQYNLSDSLYQAKNEFENKLIDRDTYLAKLALAINNYKQNTEKIILDDTKSMAAYYGLFQRVNNLLIFDPYQKKDLRLFQTVATAWKYYRADEERTKQLETFTLNALAQIHNTENKAKLIDSLNNKTTKINTEDYYNITLPDLHNKNKSLRSMIGKAVILDFTVYQSQNSSARNMLINSVYEKHKGKLDVYQVSFDADDHIWRNVAVNLPWTCVREAKSTKSDLITRFNIRSLPTIYLLNNKGEIVMRLSDLENLDTEVKKIL